MLEKVAVSVSGWLSIYFQMIQQKNPHHPCIFHIDYVAKAKMARMNSC